MTAPTPTLAERVRGLHHAGNGETAIAEALGVGPALVRKILVDAGIAKAPHLTRASLAGNNLADPMRADAKLRRF